MTGKAPRLRITLPASAVLDLAGVFTEVDEFLRGTPAVAAELERFLERRGERYPGFAVGNFIDEVSFTALWLRNLTTVNTRQSRRDTGSG